MKAVFHYNDGAHTPPTHQRMRKGYWKSYTFVVENIPTRDQVLKLLPDMIASAQSSNSLVITLKVGSSVVHPKDQFQRKIGLRLAEEALRDELFVFEAVYVTTDKIHLTLRHTGTDQLLYLTYVNSGRPEMTAHNTELAYALAGAHS